MGIGYVEEVVSYYYHFLEVGVKVRCTNFSTQTNRSRAYTQEQNLVYPGLKFIRKNEINSSKKVVLTSTLTNMLKALRG